jgi:hypothetical protein
MGDHPSHDVGYLLVARQALVDTIPHESWPQEIDDFWCYLQPRGHGGRVQEWKLHLPATPRSAEDVLARAVAVFARHRAPFRFAKDPRRLSDLLMIRDDRFITAYPDDDDQARRLAHDLHLATAELIGGL